jgi:hypothetical protein
MFTFWRQSLVPFSTHFAFLCHAIKKCCSSSDFCQLWNDATNDVKHGNYKFECAARFLASPARAAGRESCDLWQNNCTRQAAEHTRRKRSAPRTLALSQFMPKSYFFILISPLLTQKLSSQMHNWSHRIAISCSMETMCSQNCVQYLKSAEMSRMLNNNTRPQHDSHSCAECIRNVFMKLKQKAHVM